MTKRIRMENAPDWYDTPLDELHFEWSKEELLEIERYCEKIHKNIEEEEMTPKERFEATLTGKEKDRVTVYGLPLNVYAVRTLDSAADALKPMDVYKHPKLLVKAHLATVARFKFDCLYLYTLAYTEDLWGAHSRLIEYGNPVMVGDPPIKSIADLEGLEVPDPKRHGLYPGYLWTIRELKKILMQYNLDDKLEFRASTCPDSVSIAMLGMMGISGFMAATRKNPELCKKCVDLADEFQIKYIQATIDQGIHSMHICYGLGWLPIKGNEWTLDHHAKISKAMGPQVPIIITAAVPSDIQWLPLVMERGIMGPGGYAGWISAPQLDLKTVVDTARENNIHITHCVSDTLILNGPIPDLEENIKKICDYGKQYSNFAVMVGAIDYWAPQTNVDAAVAAVRKYGKY